MYKGEKQGRWITGAANLEFNDGFLGKMFFFFGAGGCLTFLYYIYADLFYVQYLVLSSNLIKVSTGNLPQNGFRKIR